MFLKINYTEIDFIYFNNQYIIKTNEKNIIFYLEVWEKPYIFALVKLKRRE